MSEIKSIVTLHIKGKLIINFRPTPLPHPASPLSSTPAGPSTASPPPSTAGPSSPPSPVAPDTQYTKSMVMDAVCKTLQNRQRVDNREAVEEVDQLYEGLQQVMGDLQFRMDDEEWSRMRKRRRNQ